MALKRSQKRNLRIALLYLLLVAAIVFVAMAANWREVQASFFDWPTVKALWPDAVVVAAKNTVIYTFIAFIGGLAFAMLLALMKLSPVGPYRWLATAYIEFFRGLPALVVMITMGLGVPLAFGWNPPGGTIGGGLIGLVLVSSAYMAETLRAGLQAVPKGQREAALSLGMSGATTMRSVILPQAIRIVIPPLTNELVTLIKDTSLLAFLGMQYDQLDLTAIGYNGLTTYANVTPLVVAAVLYLAISLPLTQLVAWMERRQAKAR
jgi:polar amino acid transport system permease protein